MCVKLLRTLAASPLGCRLFLCLYRAYLPARWIILWLRLGRSRHPPTSLISVALPNATFSAEEVLSPTPILQVGGCRSWNIAPYFCRADTTEIRFSAFLVGGEGVGCVNLFISLPLQPPQKKELRHFRGLMSQFVYDSPKNILCHGAKQKPLNSVLRGQR